MKSTFMKMFLLVAIIIIATIYVEHSIPADMLSHLSFGSMQQADAAPVVVAPAPEPVKMEKVKYLVGHTGIWPFRKPVYKYDEVPARGEKDLY